MQFEFTLQYRDEVEATRARFPGERTEPPGPWSLPVSVVTWSVVVVLSYGLFLLLNRSPAQSRAAAASTAAEADSVLQPDPLEDPLFAAGAMVAALAGACYVIPLAYLFGLRRSARPLHEKPAAVRLDDTGLALRTDTKEFTTDWAGVVAVAETRNVFVLKTMGDLRLTLPKRALGDVDRVNDLRGFLHLHITPLAEVAAATGTAAGTVPS